jgi:Flp pilus assembly protein TadD
VRLRPVIGWSLFVCIAALTGRNLAARTLLEVGSLLTRMERYDAAENAFSTAAFIRNDSCASCGMGMVYRLQSRNEDAEKWLRRSIELDPKDTCAYEQLGRMYYYAEDYPKAIEVFNKALELHSDAVLYHFLANSYFFSGKQEQSISFYELSVQLDPKYEQVLVDLGNAYGHLNRYQDAAKVLRKAVDMKPRDLKARSFLGTTLYVLDDKEGAMEQYRRVNAINRELGEEMLAGFRELAESKRAAEQVKSAANQPKRAGSK